MASECKGQQDAHRCQGNGPPRGKGEVPKALRRIRYETPRNLEEEQSDRELHAADERAGERPGSEIEGADPTEHEEDRAQEKGGSRDLVGAQSLRDRDCSERLQRLHRHG